MGRWLDHTVNSAINAPVSKVWEVWSDLESMPLWMSWIESVKTIDESTTTLPDLTEWTLAANGLRFKWKAKITERIEAEKLQWESIGGLPTKGSVRFYSQEENKTLVKLTITFELPRILAPLMESGLLNDMVTKELQGNIDRFKELTEVRHKNST